MTRAKRKRGLAKPPNTQAADHAAEQAEENYAAYAARMDAEHERLYPNGAPAGWQPDAAMLATAEADYAANAHLRPDDDPMREAFARAAAAADRDPSVVSRK